MNNSIFVPYFPPEALLILYNAYGKNTTDPKRSYKIFWYQPLEGRSQLFGTLRGQDRERLGEIPPSND